jgi:hypothetical protein
LPGHETQARDRRYHSAAIILVSAFAAPVAAGTFEDAVDAHARGDYAEALRLIRPLAICMPADAAVHSGIFARHLATQHPAHQIASPVEVSTTAQSSSLRPRYAASVCSSRTTAPVAGALSPHRRLGLNRYLRIERSRPVVRLFRLDVGGLYDGPPFLNLRLLIGAQAFGSLESLRRNLQSHVGQATTNRGVSK